MSNSTSETSVQVALRIRPLTQEDIINLPSRFQKNILSTSQFIPNQVIVQGDKKLSFNFDYVFGLDSQQKDVYDVSVRNMVDKYLEGFNVTILAYGQTSSGKTYTMGTSDSAFSNKESRGIIPRALHTLFSYINSTQFKSRKISMKVSFVEIYNEDLNDLLIESEIDDENKPQVIIREDSKGNIIWSGLQEIKVNSAEEVMGHLARGSLNRQVGATDMNSQSSRSHAIFSVTLCQQKQISSNGTSTPTPLSRPSTPSTPTKVGSPPPRSGSRLSKMLDDGDWVTVTSKFNFVDLAGSERLKRSAASGDRAKEGISINSGLLALGNVISALGDPSKVKNITHIPYRDSKLTRLLQDSLGGNAQTLMIACVSPAEYNISETINTLKYANRARNIKNSATVNQEESGWNDLEHLQNLVLKLRNEIKNLRNNMMNLNNNNNNSCPATPISGRNTPTFSDGGHGRRPSSSLSIITNITNGLSYNKNNNNNNNNNNKDIEILEEQLRELQNSYSELTQKFAKASAELTQYQDNFDSTTKIEESKILFEKSFQQNVEPVINEYDKSISELEQQLSFTRSALNNSEKIVHEHELKLYEAEELNEKNKSSISELKNKISRLIERGETTENYIKDLEVKLDAHTSEQKRDQELINELRNKISQLRTDGENSESIIQKLENKLSKFENKISFMTENSQKLEKALNEREDAYKKLEERYKKDKENDEEDQTLFLAEIEDRDNRIVHLEKKVEELMNEISKLTKNLNNNIIIKPTTTTSSPSPKFTSKKITRSSSTSSSSSSSNSVDDEIDTPFSTPPTPMINGSDYSVLNLEEKLYELQKVHQKTLIEFDDIKEKYKLCLEEITDLHEQISGTKMQLEIIDTDSDSSNNNNNNNSVNDPNSLSPYTHGSHRKARSLSDEIQGAEKKELSSMAMVQKLQIELKQLELLHEDKTIGLDAVKQEFARLEISHLETLEIVEELREEIKRRDALAQIEVMSVMTASEYSYVEGGFSTATSEVDQLDIVNRLRDEVEQLKEEQRRTLNHLSKNENDPKSKEILKIESNIAELKVEISRNISIRNHKDVNKVNNDEILHKLQTQLKELEEQLIIAQESQRQARVNEAVSKLEGISTLSSSDHETFELTQQVDKLQSEIESKSHTIAAILFPSIEHQNTIRELEDELTEARNNYQIAIEQKNDDDDDDDDEHTLELEEKIKDLENQLTKEKEAQHIPTPRNSVIISYEDPTDKTVDGLKTKLESLQQELAHKSETIENLREEQEMVVALQDQLETLKVDINHKNELIDTLKRDIVDKSSLQQRLREKEAEALAFRTKLMEVHKHEEDLESEMKELKNYLNKLESGDDVNTVLQSELEILRNKLKEVKERESVALDRLRVLKARLGSDNEEFHLHEQLDQLKITEVAQRERITILENKLSEKGEQVDEDLVKIKIDLTLAKESESAQKRIIDTLELKLKKAEDKSQIVVLKRQISEYKIKEVEQQRKMQELEAQVNDQSNKDSQKVNQLNDELETLRINENEQRKQIDTLEARLELVINDENPSIASLRDQIATLKASELDLRRTIHDLESKYSSAQKEAKIFETVKEEVVLLKQLETEQKSTIEQLQSQLKKVRSSKEAVNRELQTVKGGFSLQKELVVSHEEELKRLRAELASAKGNTSTSSEELDKISRLLSDTQRAYGDSQKKVKELEIDVGTYKLAGVAGNENVGALREELSNTKLEMMAQTDIINELETQMEIIEKERDQHLNRVNELMNVLEERESYQKDAIKELESTLITLESELSLAKNSSNLNKDTINNLEKNLSVVRSQLKEVKESEEQRTNVITELENKLQEVMNIIFEKEKEIDNQDTVIIELEELIQKTQIELQTSGISTSTANIESYKSEINKVKSSESNHNQQVKSLELKLREMKDRRDEEISKLKDANNEIISLQDKCSELQNELDELNHLSFIEKYEKIDDKMIEELTNQLQKAHEEAMNNRERVSELEKITQKLESDKLDQFEKNDDLEKLVDQLQREMESLAEEFSEAASKSDELSKQQESRIAELESALEEAKNSDVSTSRGSGITNSALSKLAAANEQLRQTNEVLNKKITETEDQIHSLIEKIKLLEKETSRLSSSDAEEIKKLEDKIKELEYERNELEEASELFYEERGKYDQMIESLTQQLRSVGAGENKAADQIAQLNEQIIKLEKEISDSKQNSRTKAKEMEKEINRLNEMLEGYNIASPRDSLSSISSRTGVVGVESSIQVKLSRQESTIIKQNSLIKTLRDKVAELEKVSTDNEPGNRSSVVSVISNSSKSMRSITGNRSKPPPPMPPPNHPPPPPPSHPQSPCTPPTTPGLSIGLPPRTPYSPPRDNTLSRQGSDASSSETASEIYKLNKKIAKLEGENMQSRQKLDSLESSLNDSETNLRVAMQQLQVLQREKRDYTEQIKSYKSQLDDARLQVEEANSTVLEEKKNMESVLEEERKAKERAETARLALESEMEKVMAKKSKFMCF